MTRVLRLTDPRAQDARLSGLHVATLARLAAAGIDVPPGFVVTTECGEWADPEAEAAVFRGYDDLGDGRGGLPVVYAEASPTSEDLAVPPGGTFETQRGISTLAQLLTAIDACRGSAHHEQGRPYYPGPPATFMAVGVFQSLRAEASGSGTTRAPAGLVGDTVLRVGAILHAEVGVDWAIVDGRMVVLRVRTPQSVSRPVA